MAEYIKREDVEKMIKEQFTLDDNDLRYIKQTVIDKLPSIDIEDDSIILSPEAYSSLCLSAAGKTEQEYIVHCKDCKFNKAKDKDKGVCGLMVYIHNANDYCSYGERKEQEQ